MTAKATKIIVDSRPKLHLKQKKKKKQIQSEDEYAEEKIFSETFQIALCRSTGIIVLQRKLY